ncbi:MAG: DUF547 domain-containing protein [Crocinitomicaceae bacterium]|nr:DUF547 domain-containing protein [Crocinitomicaceae bacterium]
MKHIIVILILIILNSCAESTDQSKQNTTDIRKKIEKGEMTPIEHNIEGAGKNSRIEEKNDSTTIKTSSRQEILTDDNTKKSSQELVNSDFHDYISLSSFLNDHVSPSGKVNYSSAKDAIGELEQIIIQFQNNLPETTWSQNQKLAYWINAYNLFTIKLVVSNYPVTSIKDISDKPWDKVFIKLGTKSLSLNDIEHEEIRSNFNEPRIHFALNCASESCPKLLNKAYKSSTLNSQLTQSTQLFLKDRSKNDLTDPNNVKISQLFDWYKTDFDQEGKVIIFINKYLDIPLDNPTISYLDYSWKLNN